MDLKRFTNVAGTVFFINPDQVKACYSTTSPGVTAIDVGGGEKYFVAGDVEDVAEALTKASPKHLVPPGR